MNRLYWLNKTFTSQNVWGPKVQERKLGEQVYDIIGFGLRNHYFVSSFIESVVCPIIAIV